MKETDLYEPLKSFLELQGYQVQAEVKNCDIAAIKENTLIAIEMKTSFNLAVVLQAVERQKYCDSVYIAIHKLPKKNHRQSLLLLKRLGIGLVTINPSTSNVKIHLDPDNYQTRKNTKKRKAVIEEVNSRKSNYNIGGSCRKKIMTVYREDCIYIAYLLDKHDQLSIKELKNYGSVDKTGSILSSNFYKWFSRIDRGVYGLTTKGKSELQNYSQFIEKITNIIK